MYHPWRHLRSLFDDGRGTTLTFAPTAGGKPAWWSPRSDHIVMKPTLLQVERRCSLAHELAHRDLGHSGQCVWPDAARQERRAEQEADDLAARRLVSLWDFIEVLCWTDDRDEAAEALWVTRRMLDVRIEGLYGGEQEIVRTELVARGVR